MSLPAALTAEPPISLISETVAAGNYHTVALKADGTVVAWWYDYYGQATIPAGLSGVIVVAAGSVQTVALKDDVTLPTVVTSL